MEAEFFGGPYDGAIIHVPEPAREMIELEWQPDRTAPEGFATYYLGPVEGGRPTYHLWPRDEAGNLIYGDRGDAG